MNISGSTTMISNNEGIKEVYEMLQTFTKDDRIREQYRLQEEFIRAQRTEQARIKRLTEKYYKGELERKAALKAKDDALKAQEKEKLAKEAAQDAAHKAQETAQKAQEAALQEIDKIKHNSIQLLKCQGHSKKEIAEMLTLSLTDVERLF